MAGINHVDVKASGQKGLASEWNKDHQQKGNHDCEQFQFENQVIENAVAFPGGPVKGQIIYRTDLNVLYIWDGAAWQDFATLDDIAIPTGTYYWSCPPSNFKAQTPDVSNIHYDDDGSFLECDGDGILFFAPVSLPHGAVITKVICYGNVAAEAETWRLRRISHADVSSIMASAIFNTEDVTINFSTIDNEDYSYTFTTTSLDNGDKIYGARITYTL